MLDVKVIFFLLLVFVMSLNQSVAQIPLDGQYTGSNGLDYQFSDTSFMVTAYDHMDIKRKAGGHYHISGDTLIFNYESIEDPSPSKYKFIKKKNFDVPLGMKPNSRDTTSIMTDIYGRQ